MAKKKQKVTKAPTGLKITRSGTKFTLTWKIGDKDYKDGQYFSYRLNTAGKSKWTNAEKIGVKATSRAITIDKKKYYPYKQSYLYDVRMRVKGNRDTYTTGSGKKKKTHKPVCSHWSDKIYSLNVPWQPSLATALDQELTNVCTFTWETTIKDDEPQLFTDTEWQTMLVKNSSETDGSKLSWNTSALDWQTNLNGEGIGSGASGSKTLTEDTSILYKNGDSYIRWFRIRSRGPRGASEWQYAYHVYALANQAKVSEVNANETEEGGFQCTVDWEAASNRQNPNDKTTVQYTLAVPDEGLTCPSGAGWTDANISKDTADEDAAVFGIDDQLSKDQCLFIRVNTQHDSHITYGKPQLAKTGFLKDPSGLSVQTDNVTYRATIAATNNSAVTDSVLVVRYVPATGDSIDVGIIEHEDTDVTVQCPNWGEQTATAFEVYAMVGSYEKQTRADGVDSYAVTPKMRSEHTISKGGAVPTAPQNVSVAKVAGIAGTVQVTWDWPWTDANGAEITWADHPDAWESTDEPESYTISNLHASKWNISGLETGKTWYIRVRLLISNTAQETAAYGPWSDIEQGTIDLSSAPNKPMMVLSNAIISGEGSTTVSWVYTTTDKTPQAYAEVALVEMNDIEVQTAAEADVVLRDTVNDRDIYIKHVRSYDTILGHTLTAQHITLDAISAGFMVGNEYNLACRVKSASGQISEWSDVVSLIVADPLICSISETSLDSETETVTDLDPETGQEVTREVTTWRLTEMPLTVKVIGAGAGGLTSVALERTKDYNVYRPDEDEFNGYKDETVALYTQVGEAQIQFNTEELIGSLDDGASYRIVATIRDELGQISQQTQEFTVNWEHQAGIPSAKITVDEEELIVKIQPKAPRDALATDVCDIYRLSADKPELIVRGAQFGETYVDPFPALGNMGGHRIVTRTKNGDYITADGTMAWVDSPELGVNPIENEELLNVIDFEGRQIKFYWDTDYSNKWAKDFQETQYLGGSIQGDWNPAVSRTGTLSTKAITVLDQDMLQDVRRLAVYAGLCHVRTADGSSYAADVQVSEDRAHDEQEMVANYSLSITRVDSQEFEGIALAQYQEEQGGNQ